MLKLLVKQRLGAIKSWLLGAGRRKGNAGPGKLLLYALLMLYAAAAVGFMLYASIFSVIAGPFFELGLGWLYFAMFVLIDLGLMFIGSVFMTKSQLFEARDNELLLSMPIPPKDILASRMIALLLMNYFLDLVAAVPAVLAWCVALRPDTGSLVFFAIVFLALPFFALALSALFGWVLSLLTGRIKRKSLVSTVISLIFLMAYMFGIGRLNTAMLALVEKAQSAARGIGAVLPVYWAGTAVAETDTARLLLTLAWMIIPFIIVYVILSATFIKTATSKHGLAVTAYTGGIDKLRSGRSALLTKEFRRFSSSSAYMLNAGLGAVFMVIAAAALLIKMSAVRGLIGMMEGVGSFVQPVVIILIGAMNGMITVSAPSVAIEGSSIWITRSMPVKTKDILLAKLRLHIIIAAPATLILSIAAAVVLKADAEMLPFMIATPLVFAVFEALTGLIANIRHPGLEWVNETQAVKSNVSVLIGMALGWAAAMATGALLLIMPAWAAIAAGTAALAVICVLEYRWLMTNGVARYETIS
jgi:ABC-2 type transport system permease protein